MSHPSPDLKYHGWACRILGLVPRTDPTTLREIERCEREHHLKVPAALREWYSLEGVDDALTDPDEECGPIPVEAVLEGLASGDERVTVFCPWQANSSWLAELIPDGSDDPPVEADAVPPRLPFSHYVLNMAWWRATFNDQPSKVYGGAKGEPLLAFGPPHMDFVHEHFEELPRVAPWFNFPVPPPHEGEPRTFRFFRPPDWFLEVNTAGDPVTGFRPATYALTANTRDSLRALDEFLWPCRDRLGP